MAPAEPLSHDLDQWLASGADTTLGGLLDRFGEKGFAIAFILLLAVPALPAPTGGATHVFEVVAMLLALQLVAGRRKIWLPARWRRLEMAAGRRRRVMERVVNLVRRLERHSRPRLRFAFRHRASNRAFGVLVLGGTVAAFVAPPFSGLDTLPALGVVLLSLGVLLEDAVVAVAGIVVGAIGVVVEVALGAALIDVLGRIV